MAKKGYSRMTKIQPAVQTFSFFIQPSGSSESQYIDLSQCASILNRRFYRQGINWAVSSFKLVSSGGATGQISINKLPNTWVVSNAWEKAFRAWKRQQDEVMEDGTQESTVARFNDFKIHMNTDHYDSGVSRNLLPYSAATLNPAAGLQVATPGEWAMSQIVVPNYGAPGTNWEPYLQMVGDNGAPSTAPASIGLVAAYENSRSVPQSPDPSLPVGLSGLDNVYRSMFDVGDNNDDIADNATLKNNDLPYVQDDYPAGSIQLSSLQVHDSEFVTGTTIGGTTRLKGGNFPCGLIEVQLGSFSNTDFLTLQVNLVPGSHRGYLCEPMTDM